MTRRAVITAGMIIVGVGLMAWSYLFGAAPWCADGLRCSEPEVQWSPALFVAGVILAFSSAVFYVVAKDERE